MHWHREGVFMSAILRSASSKPARSLCELVTATVAGALLFIASAETADAVHADRFLPVKMAIAAPSAAMDLCVKYKWACSKSGSKASLSQADIEIVRTINRQINRQIREVSDKRQYRKTDYWTLPAARRGDCEDIALLKKLTLMQAGIAPERLLMATVLDQNGQGHAVLVLRTGSGDYVLDNLTDKIRNWQSTRYTFLRMQNPNAPRNWVAVMARG